jgi:hypothetical protein
VSSHTCLRMKRLREEQVFLTGEVWVMIMDQLEPREQFTMACVTRELNSLSSLSLSSLDFSVTRHYPKERLFEATRLKSLFLGQDQFEWINESGLSCQRTLEKLSMESCFYRCYKVRRFVPNISLFTNLRHLTVEGCYLASASLNKCISLNSLRLIGNSIITETPGNKLSLPSLRELSLHFSEFLKLFEKNLISITKLKLQCCSHDIYQHLGKMTSLTELFVPTSFILTALIGVIPQNCTIYYQ